MADLSTEHDNPFKDERHDMEYILKGRLARAEKCINAISDSLKTEIKVGDCSFDMQGNRTVIRSGEDALRVLLDISNTIRDYWKDYE